MPSMAQNSINSAWFELARDYPDMIDPGVRVGQTEQTGKIEDMVNLFSNRYDELRRIIRQHLGFRETMNISDLNRQKMTFKHRTCNIIGIVCDISRTKSGGRLVELEDKQAELRFSLERKTLP